MKKLRGIIYVIAGAASYGILATFVKLASREGYSTATVTFAQFITGFLVLTLADALLKQRTTTGSAATYSINSRDPFILVAGGTCLGLTSTFYYLSVQTCRYQCVLYCLCKQYGWALWQTASDTKHYPAPTS